MENNNNNNELNQNGSPEMVQESIWADGVGPRCFGCGFGAGRDAERRFFQGLQVGYGEADEQGACFRRGCQC